MGLNNELAKLPLLQRCCCELPGELHSFCKFLYSFCRHQKNKLKQMALRAGAEIAF